MNNIQRASSVCNLGSTTDGLPVFTVSRHKQQPRVCRPWTLTKPLQRISPVVRHTSRSPPEAILHLLETPVGVLRQPPNACVAQMNPSGTPSAQINSPCLLVGHRQQVRVSRKPEFRICSGNSLLQRYASLSLSSRYFFLHKHIFIRTFKFMLQAYTANG